MKKLLSVFAWFISIVLHPLGMATIGCLLYALCYILPIYDSTTQQLLSHTILPIFLLFYVVPFVFSFLYWLCFIRKLDFNSRHHRIVLLGIISLVYAVNLIFSSSILFTYQPFLLCCLMLMIFASIISIYWRISLHTIGMGGLTALLFYLVFATPQPFSSYALQMLPFCIIAAGLAGTARLYLKAHTSAQIYVGYIVGFIATFAGMMLI